MKITFVIGGSYKGFYLNDLKKIKNTDLLIFHQNIFYEFNYKDECLNNAPVSKEIIELNKQLKCPIIVYGILNKDGKRQKCFIICNNKKIHIIKNKYFYLNIKNKYIIISDEINKRFNKFVTIFMLNKKCDFKNVNIRKKCFLCERKSVTYINNRKIYKKFRKCCYFILSFKKKMI